MTIEPKQQPTDVLAPGEEITVDVTSEKRWVETAIFLEAGREYSFSAGGEWNDASIKCGPGGTKDSENPKFVLAHFAADIWQGIEGIFHSEDDYDPGTYSMTKRRPTMPWFALVGTIANDRGIDQEKKILIEHENFLIGKGCRHEPKKSGYLYCYANDAWKFYYNNSGLVELKIKAL